MTKLNKLLTITLLIITFIHSNIYGQEKSFKIIIQSERYNPKFYNDDKYWQYQFLGQWNIDRDNKGIIDYNLIRRKITQLYPNKYDRGFLSIDLENKLYRNLKTPVYTKEAFEAGEQFIAMVNFIRNQRPNLKIGIYGLPFVFMEYKYHSLVNNYEVLKPILEKVDYISPSLYLNHNFNDKSKEYTKKYIEGVLQYSLELGRELSKPVYPYIWYLLDPSNNKVTGGEILSFEQMDFYLSTIKKYRYKKQGVSGVIWWESSDNGRMKIIRNNPENKILQREDEIDKFLYEFTKGL
jgi:hypothetical protein